MGNSRNTKCRWHSHTFSPINKYFLEVSIAKETKAQSKMPWGHWHIRDWQKIHSWKGKLRSGQAKGQPAKDGNTNTMQLSHFTAPTLLANQPHQDCDPWTFNSINIILSYFCFSFCTSPYLIITTFLKINKIYLLHCPLALGLAKLKPRIITIMCFFSIIQLSKLV